MKKLLLPFLALALIVSCKKELNTTVTVENETKSVVLGRGVSIPSITICNQTWMKKNLDVSSYRNGDVIPQVTDPAAWLTLTTGAWCYYNNDPANGSVYGKLYNWYAVNDPRGLAPAGWHIPSDAEWTTLTDCLGGAVIAGGNLKEKGTRHWLFPNTGATNVSGFTALPGGVLVSMDGQFSGKSLVGSFWSSSVFSFNAAYYRKLVYNSGALLGGVSVFNEPSGTLNMDGLSVRCVKD
jgi:uncharacterized protein (TIGR02145 family)